MTIDEALLALKFAASLARDAGVSQEQIDEITGHIAEKSSFDTLSVSSDESQSPYVNVFPHGFRTHETVVVDCTTEAARFDDGSVVLRQRAYLNPNFSFIQNKHNILGADTFRSIFKIGTPLSETVKQYQNPQVEAVDGDPGNSRNRVIR